MADTRAVAMLSLAAFVVATPAHAATCYEAISEGTAKRIFDGVARQKPADGCTLESVTTEQSSLRVVWKQGGHATEAILVLPTSCVNAPTSHGALSAVVPASAQRACPSAAEFTKALVEADGVRDLVPVHDGTTVPVVVGQRPSFYSLYRGPLAGGLASVVALSLALLGLRRWKRTRDLGPQRSSDPPAEMAQNPSADEPAAEGRPWWQRKPSRAGWGAALLVGPHLALGTWLLIVPDRLAFTAAQVVTLAHVGLATLALPLALVWTFIHVRWMRTTRPRSALSSAASRLLGVAVVLAGASGIAVLWGGDIVRAAPLHAACGVAVGVPLAMHLWLSPRRWAAGVVAAVLSVTTLGGLAARRWLPQVPTAAVIPAFAYQTRPASLYDSATTCGECHVEDYEDWKRSTHARGLELANVKREFTEHTDGTTMNLEDLGHVASGHRQAGLSLASGVCRECHAPVGFYGDDDRSAAAATGTLSEGTTCTVCHTLREVHESPDKSPSYPVSDDRFVRTAVARMPQYVSAPETVRRYLGQESQGPISHRVANWLIRWRPDVHKADYHSEVLDSSRACEACHSLGGDDPSAPLVYVSWRASHYNTGDTATTVTCQDCHMTRHMTGKPVRDPERAVAWGPVRPNSRSHLFLGGNVRAATELGDPELARLQHEYNEQALSVRLMEVSASPDFVRVTALVHSDLIGHNFPALESQVRFGWVQIKAFDANNTLLAATDPPKNSADFEGPSPLIMAPMTDPGRGILTSGSGLELHAQLKVSTSPRVDHVVAEVHQGMDPDPIASTSRSLP